MPCMYKYSKFPYKNVNSTFLQKSNTYYIEICPLFIVLYEIFSIYILLLTNHSFFIALFSNFVAFEKEKENYHLFHVDLAVNF